MAPDLRVRAANDAPLASGGRYVLYWMIAARRARLELRARSRARARAGARPAAARARGAARRLSVGVGAALHQFVLDGMRDNARAFDQPGVRYCPTSSRRPAPATACSRRWPPTPPWSSPTTSRASSCRAWSPRAAARLPRAARGGGRQRPAADARRRPRLPDGATRSAATCRRRSARTSRERPRPIRSRAAVPARGRPCRPASPTRWPDAFTWLRARRRGWRACRSTTRVAPAGLARRRRRRRGPGSRHFVPTRLARYVDGRNDPAHDVGERPVAVPALRPRVGRTTSSHAVMRARGLARRRCRAAATGRAHGWWGVSPAAEAFLDQLVTWRELGFNMCAHRARLRPVRVAPGVGAGDRWRATPATRASPRSTPRDEFDAARDPRPAVERRPAAARAATGRIHNYLRMLWGKKILEWSPTPEDALATMIELNNRYALDGRDPNSYSGIFWISAATTGPGAPSARSSARSAT